jgi:hypothetical protein
MKQSHKPFVDHDEGEEYKDEGDEDGEDREVEE